MRFTPMPLVLRKLPFDGDDWHFEIKMDGFRALAYIARDGVTLISRRDHVFTQFDPLRLALRREINVLSCVLDGEIVCLDDQGKPCFLDLMRRVGHPVFVAFDVLTVNAEDLRSLPLWQRKQRLRRLVPQRASSVLAEGRQLAAGSPPRRHRRPFTVAARSVPIAPRPASRLGF